MLKPHAQVFRMKKLFILSISLLASAAYADSADPLKGVNLKNSPFEVCQAITFVGKSDYEKNKEFWDKAINECNADVQILPDTGFFNTVRFKLGEADENRRSALFLKRVGERARGYVDLNNRLTEHLIRCAKADKAWFDTKAAAARSKEEEEFYDFSKCNVVLDALKDTMNETRPKLRQAMALSRYEDMIQSHELDSNTNPARYLNTYMQAVPGLVIPRGVERLAKEETNDAVKQFRADTKEIEENFEKRLADLKKREAELKSQGMKDYEVRQRMPQWYYHYDAAKKWNNPDFQDHLKRERQERFVKYRAQYNELLQKAPILAFLGKKDPSNAEIAEAAQKLLENGIAEKKLIEENLRKGEARYSAGRGGSRERSDEDQAKNMFDFMKYGPVVREVISEDPSQCKTATGIANYVMNNDTLKTSALAVSMLGGVGYMAIRGTALVAGTALAGLSSTTLAVAAALPFSATFYYRDYKNFIDAERRTFNVPETERFGTQIADLKDYEEAKNALTLSLAIAGTGIDFWGLGLVKGGMLMGSAALAGRLSSKAANSIALKQALRAKGLTAAEVDNVFRQLNSGDPELAGRAAAKLIKDLGLDDAEIRFMRQAAAKGVLKEQNAEGLMDPIRKQLAALDAKERKVVYSKAMEILQDVNSAKLNEYTRRQVLESAIAGARFGIKDPKVLAAKINDWEEGLEGLTKTFQIAKQRLDDPEIRQIANLDLRHDAAFGKALDDMRASNPELKAMPDSEWNSTVKPQLLSCGLGKK
jgi:hypothetical protein